ncbi:MAG: aldehyde dehydrogenase family protein, partial [Thioalkalispiraceae bacterium]
MSFTVINPATGETIKEVPAWDENQIENALAQAAAASPDWQARSFEERATLMRKAAQTLRDNVDEYAATITREMGKLIGDARAEVEKCASVCDYYAENAAGFLKDEVLESDASTSYV